MRIVEERWEADAQKMANYICQRIPADGERIVLADGGEGDIWADLCPFWDEEAGWLLEFGTNEPEWTSILEIYKFFRRKDQTSSERNSGLNERSAKLRADQIYKELSGVPKGVYRC